MAVSSASHGTQSATRAAHLGRFVVPGSVVFVLACRLPFLNWLPTPDEAGYLLVGRQWHTGGSSLYGDYWVDRPPLLISIFRWAADLGGPVPLRLMGCLCAAGVVLGVAYVANRIGGVAAGRWAAVAASVLIGTPLFGAFDVNGELLAAPFIMGGVAAALAALRQEHQVKSVGSAMAAGASSVAAMAIKQNMADALLYTVVLYALAKVSGQIDWQRFARLCGAFTLGGLSFAALLATWTIWHGTSLSAVYEAIFVFRLKADQVLEADSGGIATRRLDLFTMWLHSGAGFVMVLAVWACLTRLLRGIAVWALLSMMIFSAVSVVSSGNYWEHYLVQVSLSTSVFAGILATRHVLGSIFVGIMVILGIWSMWAKMNASPVTTASLVGEAISASAQPHDTIFNAYGRADLVFASGLRSPYEHLWSLPIKTLDPRLSQLNQVMRGPEAPTWFIEWGTLESWGLQTHDTELLLQQRYRPVAVIRGCTIYLLKGADRPVPHEARP